MSRSRDAVGVPAGRYFSVGLLALGVAQLASVALGVAQLASVALVWLAAGRSLAHVALYGAPVVALVVGIVVGAARLRQASVFGPVLLALLCGVSGVLAMAFVPRFVGPALASRADGVAIADAPQHRSGGILKFADGQIPPDAKRGEAALGGLVSRRFVVAPIVPEGWTPDQPVPAWAASMGGESSEWAKNHRAGVAVGPAERAFYHQAIMAIPGLKSADGAPIVEWVAQPDAALRQRGVRAAAAVLGPYFVWLLFSLFVAARPARPAATTRPAVGPIGGRQAVRLFENALRSDDEDVRTAATRALGRVRDPGAVANLLASLGQGPIQFT